MISNPIAINSPVLASATSTIGSTLRSSTSVYLFGPDYNSSGATMTASLACRPSYLIVQNQGSYNMTLRIGNVRDGGTAGVIIAPLATFEIAVDDSAGVELYNSNPSVTVPITGITKANPGVVTTGSAHGLTAGQSFLVYGVSGMTEVNNLNFIAMAGVAATTINLSADGVANFDTSGFGSVGTGGFINYSTYADMAYSVTQI